MHCWAWLLNFFACVCVFVFSFLSRLHWSAHIGPRPQSEGRGDLIVHHLGAVERWANVPHGWHGNGLLSSGWTVCQRQFLVVATLLQHPPDLNAEMQRKVCVCLFLRQIFYGGGGGVLLFFLVRVCVCGWILEGGIVYEKRPVVAVATRETKRAANDFQGDEKMKSGKTAGRQEEKSNYSLCSTCHGGWKRALIFYPCLQVTTTHTLANT